MRLQEHNSIIKDGVCFHHVWPGLQIFEVVLLYSCHHPVVVQILSHLHVIWVGLEKRVGSCYCFGQLIDLKGRRTHIQAYFLFYLIQLENLCKLTWYQNISCRHRYINS